MGKEAGFLWKKHPDITLLLLIPYCTSLKINDTKVIVSLSLSKAAGSKNDLINLHPKSGA